MSDSRILRFYSSYIDDPIKNQPGASNNNDNNNFLNPWAISFPQRE